MKRAFTIYVYAAVFLTAVFTANFSAAQTPQYLYPGGTSNNSWPFNAGAGGSNKVQWVYLPGDFTPAITAGFITALYFKSNSTPNTYSFTDLRLSLGYAGFTTFPSGTYVTGLTVVYGPQTTSLTLQSNGWIAVQLPTPFYYDGVSNLIVEATSNNANGVTMAQNTSGGNKRIYGNVSSSTGTANAGLTGFGFDLFAGFPCTDTPKTSVNGPIRVCPGKPFTVRPDSFYADADYLWEYSNNGTAWSNFTGVPGLYGEIKDSLLVAKWYRLTVKCKANPNLKWTTPPHKVSIAPFYYCYCDNEVTSDAGADIGNLTIIKTGLFDSVYKKGQLVTGSATPVFNNNTANRKYTSYHDSLGWPCLYRDTTYLFNVTQIHSGGSFETGVVQAYIDYNRDGLYNPNTERVFVQAMNGLNANPHIVQVTGKVPSNAQIGPTGMRVIISKDTVKGAPCDTISGGGEVEDYIVEICHRPCTGPVNAGLVVSTDSSMCAGYEYTLTDTTYEKAQSGFLRAWQVSGDNSTWFNIPNSQNKDTLQRVFAGQPLYYRLRTICAPTHDTNYSAGTLINVKPGYKCYCYSKAVGGLNVDTSDIGGVTIADYSSNAGGPHLLNALAVKPRTDFTDITPINLFIDSVYQFSVFHTMPVVEHGDAKVTIFMDFNNNHKYDIPEERIYTGYTAIGSHTLVDNVIIPQKAITDVPTGMRVIINNDVGPNVPSDSACGPYTSGETEDYVLIFRKAWPAGINGQATLTGFNVHPNPTNGKFYVQFSTQAEVTDVQVRVTNVTGQAVHNRSYQYEGGMFYQ
ncbi:MAG TPA: GEVED domain-containing protein, partial [Flavipsychrobacter sp.]